MKIEIPGLMRGIAVRWEVTSRGLVTEFTASSAVLGRE